MKRRSASDVVFDIFNYAFLAFLSILFLYPILYTLFASLSDPVRLLSHTGLLFHPLGLSTKGYEVVFQNPNITTGYANTVFYTLCGTAVSLILTIFGAYALSKKGYRLKKFATFFVVFTMYFSGGMIPHFLLVRSIGLYDTRLALIIPGAINTWNMIVMKTAFQSVPASLDESAKIDGANDFIVLFRIFLPLILPTLAVMTLFYAVQYWNAWFNALLYVQDRNLFPLQLFLREILIANSTAGNATTDVDTFLLDEVLKYATIIISTVPVLCIYPFVQKYFVSGMMLGSIKE